MIGEGRISKESIYLTPLRAFGGKDRCRSVERDEKRACGVALRSVMGPQDRVELGSLEGDAFTLGKNPLEFYIEGGRDAGEGASEKKIFYFHVCS
jgi:hypothetical protein